MVGCAARCLAVSTQRWYRSKPFVKTTSVARHLLSFHVGDPEFVTQVSRELNPTVGVVVLVKASPVLLTPDEVAPVLLTPGFLGPVSTHTITFDSQPSVPFSFNASPDDADRSTSE